MGRTLTVKRQFVIICIGVLAVFVSVILYCYIIYNVNENTSLTSEEEIIAIFKNNKDNFVSVSNTMFAFQYTWDIRKNVDKHNEDIGGWKFSHYSNMQLSIQHKEDFDKMSGLYEAASNEIGIEYILKDLNFKSIQINTFLDSDCLYFIKHATLGHEAGIIYCPNEYPKNPYITRLTEIEPSWYYYEG